MFAARLDPVPLPAMKDLPTMEASGIELLPVGDEGAESHTRPLTDNSRKAVLQSHHEEAVLESHYGEAVLQSRHREATIVRANIISITHGTMSPGGDPATLLVFEFCFSMQRSGRLTGYSITISFEDSGGDVDLRPKVYRIAPKGVFALNKTQVIRDIKESGNVQAKVDSSSFGAGSDYAWEMGETKGKEHFARLVGLTKIIKGVGMDDAAEWSLEEDNALAKKEGVPAFLRTAVLLRRKADVPFSLLIKIWSEVDFKTSLHAFSGRKKVDKMDPIQVDPGVNPKQLRVTSLGLEKVDLSNMEALSLHDLCGCYHSFANINMDS